MWVRSRGPFVAHGGLVKSARGTLTVLLSVPVRYSFSQ
ncbi:hypothetical protein SGLAM104S_01853 [Streptomyces glaucescens]